MKKIILAITMMLTLISCGTKKEISHEWVSIDPYEFATKPMHLFNNQWMALATAGPDGTNENAMTIAWGTIGMLWNKPVVIVYVSSSRFTKHLMDENRYFTVTGFADEEIGNNALTYLGSHSGRNVENKIEESGLTAEYTDLGNIRFAEGNLCIECKVLYQDEFKREAMPEEIENMYKRMGMHSFYIGEIVNIWERETGYPEAENRWDKK